MIAFMSVAVMTQSFTACSKDDSLLEPVPGDEKAMTRGGNLESCTYVERSWDGRQVVSSVKFQYDCILLGGDIEKAPFFLEAGKWYVVAGDAAKYLFPFETRVPACFFRPYTCIEER